MIARSPAMDQSVETALAPTSPAVVEKLVANHREFLAFLQARVANRTVAEELLQAAFVRTLEKGGAIRDDENAVAWFYRLLRNAVIDHYRKNAVQVRGEERISAEAQLESADELNDAVCKCINSLLPTLKTEYASLLERVDLQGTSVTAAAAELGITPNNAMVRLHRARQALKRQLERSCGTCASHGCLDCTCGDGVCG
jgi:RNA polymerase sigma factor (sigma-70 family)